MLNDVKIFVRIFISLMVIPLATGCFTGIESTPAISDREVQRHSQKETPEERYFDNLLTEIPPCSTPGKQWVVTDPKIKLILDASAMNSMLNVGDTLSLLSVENVTSLDGLPLAELRFSTRGNKVYSYRTSLSPQEFQATGKIKIPFAVDIDVVESVRKKMSGKTFYILTTARYDLADQPLTGRRFVPVSVDKVDAGNNYYPIKLTLTDDKGLHFRLYMSVDSSSNMPRKFSSLFSLTDPKLKYPAITDDNWKHIINGQVAQGMTRDEARLALGAPSNIDRRPGYSVLREIWTYENGRYLIFDDGILQTFRQ